MGLGQVQVEQVQVEQALEAVLAAVMPVVVAREVPAARGVAQAAEILSRRSMVVRRQ